MTKPEGSFAPSTEPADWLGVDEARKRILSAVTPLGVERVALADSVGRALAEEIIAGATLPPWDNSAMDGYAVRAEDIVTASQASPSTLTVVGSLRAGDEAAPEVLEGQAVRIMTGAPVPAGADTVVRVEDTDAEAEAGRVRVLAARDAGRHIRGAGQDMLGGESLLPPGQSVTPGVIGVLVAAGCDSVLVHRSPTVAILTTGDELRGPDRYDDVRAGHGIPDSNGPMLGAMVASVGAYPVDLGLSTDDPHDLAQRIEAASESDVLITVGGASMGEADLVKRVLEQVGFERDFWRVRMKPGSPVSFGWLPWEDRRQAVFSLPGNPSSAFVTFEVFVRPFLLALAGHRRTLRRTMTCVASERLDVPAALTYFHRVTLTPTQKGMASALTGPQGSGLVRGLAGADGLAMIPEGLDLIDVGDPVQVMLLEDGPGGDVFAV